jgi:hypothetical protein
VKALLMLLLLLFSVMPAFAADEVFPDVRYVSGRSGFDEKVKGTLTLTESELRFADQDGKPLFTIPLAEITEVSNSVEQNPGSTGAKLLLGVFASKKEEFLYVSTETASAAEALVFKCRNKTSPAMLAKIRFQMKKAKPPMETAEKGEAVQQTANIARSDTTVAADSLMNK